MLTLLLLRHAKAEASGRGDDHARRLTERGEQDAADIGTFLAEHDLRPDLALVSTATRTSRTYALAAARLGGSGSVRNEAALYDATAHTIATRVAAVRDARCLMVVGHNPGIMEAAIALASGGDFAEVERLRGRFPPGGLAVIGFANDDWTDACASGGQLDALVYPEDLAGWRDPQGSGTSP